MSGSGHLIASLRPVEFSVQLIVQLPVMGWVPLLKVSYAVLLLMPLMLFLIYSKEGEKINFRLVNEIAYNEFVERYIQLFQSMASVLRWVLQEWFPSIVLLIEIQNGKIDDEEVRGFNDSPSGSSSNNHASMRKRKIDDEEVRGFNASIQQRKIRGFNASPSGSSSNNHASMRKRKIDDEEVRGFNASIQKRKIDDEVRGFNASTLGSSSNNLVQKSCDEIVDGRVGQNDQQWREMSVDELREFCSQLPLDVLGEVASHLPPRKLFLLRSLINRCILNHHLKNAEKIKATLVHAMCKGGGGVWQNIDLYFDIENKLVESMKHQDYKRMLGTGNGIVLYLEDENFVVRNPITRMNRNLPPPILEFDPDNNELYDFHYLESEEEYFILRIVQCIEESYRTDMEMYSSSTDSWKVIETPVPSMRGGEEISFEVNSISTLPLYHVGCPFKIDDRFYYIAVDPQHSYYVALLAFDMKNYAFHIVKIFPREVYPMSYDVQLGVCRDRFLALLITNVDTGEKLLTTFNGASFAESSYSWITLLPETILETLEENGAAVRKVFPFTDSLHAVTLEVPH